MKIKTSTISELCNVEYGTRVTRKRDGGSIYPVYGGGGKTFFLDKMNRKNRVVIARFAMSKKCTRFVKGDFFLNDSGLTLSPKTDEISQDYLDSIIPALNNLIYNMGKGTAQRNLDMKQFRLLRISYPSSLSEQKNIVTKLKLIFKQIDNSINLNNINLKNSIKLKKEIINDIINNVDKKYLKKFQDSCHFVRGPFGGSLTKSMFKDKGYVVYEQQHAIHNQFLKLRYFIDENKFNKMKRFELKPGDLIMSCSGVTLGKIAIVPDKIPKGIINQALLKITPNQLILKEYLKIIMTSDYFQSILWDVSGGAAQPNVPSVRTIKEFLIPVVPIKEQKKILKKINFINQLKLDEIYLKKLDQFKSLKQSITSNISNSL